jgi:two-component system, NarL family, nitrate/nitrite response regulator NarL
MGIRKMVGDANKTPAIAVLLVCEHSIFREGLRKLIEHEPGLTVVADVPDAEEAMRVAAAVRPVILIVGFSGRPLIRMMRSLQELTPGDERMRTIVITSTIHKTHMFEALQLGAAGILLNETPARVLFDSIRSVAAGEYWVGRTRLSGAVPSLHAPVRNTDGSAADSEFGLTQRELEIVAAVRRGDSNRVIARQFSITENTVKHHLTRVFAKTGVVSRLELAVFAMKHQIAQETTTPEVNA